MPAGGESYYVFNKSAAERPLWTCQADYERFLLILYLYNTRHHVVMRDVLSKYSAKRFKGQCFDQIFRHEYSDKALVDVLGYCILPDRFELILRPKSCMGIQRFMQKVCGAYSMYFNQRYERTGTLFQGRYKAMHIACEAEFRRLFASMHLDPLELIQPGWKEKGICNKRKARSHILQYRYTSFLDLSTEREQHAILADCLPEFLKEQGTIDELMKWESQLVNPKARAL